MRDQPNQWVLTLVATFWNNTPRFRAIYRFNEFFKTIRPTVSTRTAIHPRNNAAELSISSPKSITVLMWGYLWVLLAFDLLTH
jgi:hypothetical protein